MLNRLLVMTVVAGLAIATPARAQGPPASGSGLSLKFGGYVKVDFIQDFSAIGDTNEFKTNTIPAEGSAAAAQSGGTTIHARETRLNVELRSDSGTGPHFRAFAEGDFFGDKNAFRMRHAYGEFGSFLGGQTWSTFQDISARPLTVDFEGSDGEVFLRTPLMRFTRKLNADLTVAIAAEHPSPQFAVPTGLTGSPRNLMPDIPGFVRYQQGRGHVQVAGLLRQLRFDSTGPAADVSTMGWGINTTLVLPVATRDQLQGQFAIGDGTARYIESLSGLNLDATLSANNSIVALRSQSANLGFIHFWDANFKSGLSYSTATVEDAPGLPAGTVDRLQDFRVNLFWTPYRQVDFAGELMWGQRSNKDGTKGEAWRFQFAAIYRLG